MGMDDNSALNALAELRVYVLIDFVRTTPQARQDAQAKSAPRLPLFPREAGMLVILMWFSVTGGYYVATWREI